MGPNVHASIKWLKEYVFAGYYSEFFYMTIVGVTLTLDFISVASDEQRLTIITILWHCHQPPAAVASFPPADRARHTAKTVFDSLQEMHYGSVFSISIYSPLQMTLCHAEFFYTFR